MIATLPRNLGTTPDGLPQRPVLRYFGGKSRLAKWIAGQFPKHHIYVEPFFGAGSVFFRKPRAPCEVVNDLDDEIVNMFEVLRGPEHDELLRRLVLTPYAQVEYERAFDPTDDPIERARRLIIRSHMGHGTSATQTDRKKGFRADGPSARTRVAAEWAKLPDALQLCVERLAGVVIRQEDGLDLIARYSDPSCLIYADPPYHPNTRSEKKFGDELYHRYAHELDDAGHLRLLEALEASRSMVMLSGYDNALYGARLTRHAGWTVRRKKTTTHLSHSRVECLWLNEAAAEALHAGPLFGGDR